MSARYDRAETLQKRAAAVRLRLAGASYERIAEEVGYAGHSGARKAVEAGLKLAIKEPAEEVVQQELARLDQMYLGLVGKGATSGNVPAVLAALKVMDRRAKYLGLDVTKLDVTTHDGDLQDLDAALAEWAGAGKT